MTSKPTDGATAPAKPRRRLNASKRRALKAAQMAVYLKQVGRKAQKRMEPNDRHDWYGLGEKIRKLSPEETDLLMREDEDIVDE